MMALGICIAFVGIILVIAALLLNIKIKSYNSGSAIVTGIVQSKRYHKRNNGTSYELTIIYVINGVSYKKVVGTIKREFDVISVGDNFQLIYKIENPKKAANPQELDPKSARIVLIMGITMTIAGILLFFIGSI